MKKQLLIVLLALFAFGCSKDGGTGNGNNNNNNTGNDKYSFVIFENNSYNGSALITYTDGSAKSADFKNGILKFPLSSEGNKTIRSILPEGQSPILIGRLEGDSILLNYNNGILNFRTSVNGYIPIGTYAEFQLISKDADSRSGSYSLETDLDLMNEEWVSVNISGIFEGNAHALKNLKLRGYNSGLFGSVGYNPNATAEIRNIIVSSGSLETENGVGGIIVIAADNAIISGCSNYANVISYAGWIGGILGKTEGGVIIEDCHNYGNLSMSQTGWLGGIVGYMTNSSNQVYNYADNNISNCTNEGKINGGLYTGGIIGEWADYLGNLKNSFHISNSNNKGEISGRQYVGGIAGKTVSKILSCYNSGNIHNTNNHPNGTIIGGIVGQFANDILSSYNKGNIDVYNTQSATVGGIAGENYANGTIIACYNSGNIANSASSSQVNSSFGGIIGYFGNSNNDYVNALKNCYNIGKINSSNGYIGGIIGNQYISAVISSNYWKENTDNVSYATGFNEHTWQSDNKGASKFSSTTWPSASNGWTIGNGTSDAYWKSLGSWNNGNAVYPKLFFEN